ncbi:unnamed protein product [Ambrosiozyma monospora]|uniref:Unnamed protein product n=1 Tax=Ambrosiozyma monospora TaxID=43982 RepID=A0ACB5SVL3_AMBMO|nr:unnamed protein product [Ambrosiozyma monospora]
MASAYYIFESSTNGSYSASFKQHQGALDILRDTNMISPSPSNSSDEESQSTIDSIFLFDDSSANNAYSPHFGPTDYQFPSQPQSQTQSQGQTQTTQIQIQNQSQPYMNPLTQSYMDSQVQQSSSNHREHSHPQSHSWSVSQTHHSLSSSQSHPHPHSQSLQLNAYNPLDAHQAQQRQQMDPFDLFMASPTTATTSMPSNSLPHIESPLQYSAFPSAPIFTPDPQLNPVHSSPQVQPIPLTLISTPVRVSSSFQTSLPSSPRTRPRPTNRPDKRYKCEYENCDKSYSKKYRLKKHIQTKHAVIPPTFPCLEPDCGKIYSTDDDLKRHHIIHTDRYECHHCKKRYDRKDRFENHAQRCSKRRR